MLYNKFDIRVLFIIDNFKMEGRILFYSAPTERKCDYCTETITSNLKRCPYCASLQDKIEKKSSMSEGLKVFITFISLVIPVLGQIFGILIGIIFSSDADIQKKRFGKALIIANSILFSISCLLVLILILALFM